MCLILFAYKAIAETPLVVAANRDETYERPTQEAAFWYEQPQILAGKDVKEGGIWMGITRQGRFAAITNFRDNHAKNGDISRGFLTRDFLISELSIQDYLQSLERKLDRYNGFNLLLGDQDSLFYLSNRGQGYRRLEPGIYGLSNGLLDAPWPKIQRGKKHLAQWLQSDQNPDSLIASLRCSETADDALLPDTGVGIESERLLSPMFIQSAFYGTRSSTVLVKKQNGQTHFLEQNYGPEGIPQNRSRHLFQISVNNRTTSKLQDRG